VYWQGRVARDDVAKIVEEAERAFLQTGEKFTGSIDAYGTQDEETEHHFGPGGHSISKLLTSPVVPTFEACRAELTSRNCKVVVWAAVTGKPVRTLEEGGENISVSIPQPYFFDGPFRPVILHAVSRTLAMDETDTTALLDDIKMAIVQKKFVPGN